MALIRARPARTARTVVGSAIRRPVMFAIGAAMVLSPLYVAPQTASADPYAECSRGSGVCAPDDDAHYWCYGNLHSKALRTGVRRTIRRMERSTVVNGLRRSSCRHADARFNQADLEPGIVGLYECKVWAGSDHPRVCAKARVIIDKKAHKKVQRHVVAGSDGKVEHGELGMNLRLSMCHELGHSLGFTHHDASWYRSHASECMTNQWIEEDVAGTWQRYNVHHARHVKRFLRTHPILQAVID